MECKAFSRRENHRQNSQIVFILEYFKGFLAPFFTEKGQDMKEVFQEYGGVIVTIIAIVSLIGVISAVIGTGETGIIGAAFTELIENFFEQAGVAPGTEH